MTCRWVVPGQEKTWRPASSCTTLPAGLPPLPTKPSIFPPPPVPARSCVFCGEVGLILTSGDYSDPYAVCFPRFRVNVTFSAALNKSVLRIIPDLMANSLKYGEANATNGAKASMRSSECHVVIEHNACMQVLLWSNMLLMPALAAQPGLPQHMFTPTPHQHVSLPPALYQPLQDCPKSYVTTLVAPIEGGDVWDLNFAFVRAMRAASFSASYVEGGAFDGGFDGANRAILDTPGTGPVLTHAVVGGFLGSAVFPATTAAAACGSVPNCADAGQQASVRLHSCMCCSSLGGRDMVVCSWTADACRLAVQRSQQRGMQLCWILHCNPCS